MKSTGMVRKVDELGRIVIPVELRRMLDIDVKDPVEIFIDGDQVILKKYVPNMSCHVTGKVTNQNVALLNGGLVISQEGAEELVRELEKHFKL